jgi:hypothetical protein
MINSVRLALLCFMNSFADDFPNIDDDEEDEHDFQRFGQLGIAVK